MANYSILTHEFSEKNCMINKLPTGLKKGYRLAVGERCAKGYPDEAKLKMSKIHPGIVTPDVIHNDEHTLMVSIRAKRIFQEYLGKAAEFLPFELLNHRGKPVEGYGFFVNPLGSVDCVDRKRTVGDDSFIAPGEYSAVYKLFLDESKIPKQTNLFRLAPLPTLMIVSKGLRKALEKAQVSGIKYWELSEDLPNLGL